MKPESLGYLRYRMDQAQEALGDARQLMGKGSPRAVVNRLYYACFYMVSALLLTEDNYAAKHSGIEALFVRHWINTGRLPAEMGRFYRHLFKRRQQGDYAYQTTFDPKDVQEWMKEANDFVARVARETEKCLEKDG